MKSRPDVSQLVPAKDRPIDYQRFKKRARQLRSDAIAGYAVKLWQKLAGLGHNITDLRPGAQNPENDASNRIIVAQRPAGDSGNVSQKKPVFLGKTWPNPGP